ncbi:unnamed protein product [Pleuronectes platessa]|uniref:Uncharacterized protein n=1 Tax=Pleuronectes platessa TaxID=8262 RepID=A0A9N7VP87_PLEPL|nr:unnamed protein product [Pleuronectes platessa]
MSTPTGHLLQTTCIKLEKSGARVASVGRARPLKDSAPEQRHCCRRHLKMHSHLKKTTHRHETQDGYCVLKDKFTFIVPVRGSAVSGCCFTSPPPEALQTFN